MLPRHASLLDFCFREPPTFRQGFDRHVKQWVKVRKRELWFTYHREPEFRAHYERELAARPPVALPPLSAAA